MDKQSLGLVEKYEQFRGLDSRNREVKELGNGRQQIIYRNQPNKNMTLEQRKQALKNKLINNRKREIR
jgi:hypothetical protein